MNNPEIARLCGQLIQELNKIEDTDELIDCLNDIRKIGRASCRERV